MRQITLKYGGECGKCSAPLAVGAQAMYEKHVGLFCLGHEPTDPEEIRRYKQESADRKADRYEEWAGKREAVAAATFKRNEVFTGDIAFNTQPGHIPLRARIIAQEDRAGESLFVAKEMRRKAEALRHVRVAGDAERERQERRDKVRPMLKPGMLVHTTLYGDGVIKRVNRKTATLEKTGHYHDYTVNVDLSWISIYKDKKEAVDVTS